MCGERMAEEPLPRAKGQEVEINHQKAPTGVLSSPTSPKAARSGGISSGQATISDARRK